MVVGSVRARAQREQEGECGEGEEHHDLNVLAGRAEGGEDRVGRVVEGEQVGEEQRDARHEEAGVEGQGVGVGRDPAARLPLL